MYIVSKAGLHVVIIIMILVNHHHDHQKVNDYEEDNAEYGVESVGWIAAHLKAKDMGWAQQSYQSLSSQQHQTPVKPENLAHCFVTALHELLTFDTGLSWHDTYFIDKNTKQARQNVTETLLLSCSRHWTP